jgi:hypothetical protein
LPALSITTLNRCSAIISASNKASRIASTAAPRSQPRTICRSEHATRMARLTSDRASVPHYVTLQHYLTRSRYPGDRAPSITIYCWSLPVT